MSYQTAKRLPLSPKRGIFSGGYVDNVADYDLAPYYSPYSRNIRMDGQSVIVRPGYSLYSTLTDGSYPKGISGYLRGNSSNDRLVIRHNQSATQKLVSINTTDGAITPVTTGTSISSDNRMVFTNVGDFLYCMNGSDPFGKLQGTTYTTPDTTLKGLSTTGATGTFTTNELITGGTSGATANISRDINGSLIITVVTGTFVAAETITGGTSGKTATIAAISEFAPAFGVIFNSSHWVSGRSFAPNVVFKSIADDYQTFTGVGSDSFTFSETITGLSANNEALFYFTKSTISVTGSTDITDTAGTVTYTTRSLQVKDGAVNHSSIIEAGNNIYFLSSSNAISKIMKGTNVIGFEVEDISQRAYTGIENFMASLDTDQNESFGCFLPSENLIKWHVMTSGGEVNDLVIVYSTSKDQFYIDDNKYFYDGTFFKGYNYTISMLEPKVYLDEYGHDDEDMPTPMVYFTKYFYISEPTFDKIVRESRTLVDINELASLRQEMWLNGGIADMKTITKANISNINATGGLGTAEIGTFAIGEDGPSGSTDNYYEVPILRPKSALNKRCYKIQFRYYNAVVGSKVRLKNISLKADILPELATALTA